MHPLPARKTGPKPTSSVFKLATGAHSFFGALQVEPLAPACGFKLLATAMSNYSSELELRLTMTDCN